MVGLVLEFTISVRFHPLSDAVFHTEAHSVSTVLLGDQKKVIEDLASMNHSLTRLYLHSAGQWDDMYSDRQRLRKEICKPMHGREENGSDWS